MSDMDANRICTSFAHVTRRPHELPESEWIKAAMAPLEHHFDNHEHCGEFCKRKKELLLKIETDKFYRCKDKDAALCKELKEAIAPHISLEKLREVAHAMDTNVNESLNNAVAWLAPKNKTCSGSKSLRNRISIAVGVHLVACVAVQQSVQIDFRAALVILFKKMSE